MPDPLCTAALLLLVQQPPENEQAQTLCPFVLLLLRWRQSCFQLCLPHRFLPTSIDHWCGNIDHLCLSLELSFFSLISTNFLTWRPMHPVVCFLSNLID